MTGFFYYSRFYNAKIKHLRTKIINKLASLPTESEQYARPAPGCHHMGWDLTVIGVLAYLHLHILLLPWVAKRPQHHPQKSLHKPLHRWVTVPGRDQQGWSAGKKNASCMCNMQHARVLLTKTPTMFIFEMFWFFLLFFLIRTGRGGIILACWQCKL